MSLEVKAAVKPSQSSGSLPAIAALCYACVPIVSSPAKLKRFALEPPLRASR